MDNSYDSGPDLYTQALLDFADRFEQGVEETQELPSEWMEKYYIIPTPRDPVTGEDLPSGPIKLSSIQKRVVNEALSKVNGMFKYSTVLYSAPKKSGKSAIASGVGLYMADKTPYAQIYCLANDGKNSKDRLYLPIWRCLNFHHQRNLRFKDARVNQTEAYLSNYAHIEAIPCDASGEAGSEPTAVLYCFDEETEILTRTGWKGWDTLKCSDEVATLSKDGVFEWQLPSAVHAYHYKGIMHEYNTKRMSIKVTPNHRMYGKYYRDWKQKQKATWEKKTIEDALNYAYMGIRVSSVKWEAVTDLKDVVISGTKRKPELHLDLRLFIQLMAWYLSEGCTHKSELVLIGQSKEKNSDKHKEILDLLVSCGFSPKVWGDGVNIAVYDVRLAKYFEQFGLSYDKYIPEWVKNLPTEYLELFISTYKKGDGYTTYAKTGSFSISTNSSQMRDDLIEIGQKAGYFISFWEYQDKRWGRVVYTVNFKQGRGGERCVEIQPDTWREVEYDGHVFCPTTENGVVYVRRRGSCYWQGQSEFWGYIEEAKRRLFTEMTLPPTLYGKSIRWIESYAGFMGVSDLLWTMYKLGVLEGEPHPDFTDLIGKDGEPVVWVNHHAHMFTYWDTMPRMIWQNSDYYVQEAQILSPSEFARIHQNQWVSPVGSYIQPEWWEYCGDPTLLPLKEGSSVPCVVGIDAALTGDCAALVIVTRDPRFPDTDAAVRYAKIWKASPQRPINIEDDIGRELRRVSKLFNIVCVAYDSYQMEGLAQNYRRGNVTLSPAEQQMISQWSREDAQNYLLQEQRAAQRWFYKFGQQAPRAVADKRLYDMIVGKRLHYNPADVDSDINMRGTDETLTKHAKQAGVKNSGNQMRIEKLSNDAKVDGLVALAMALDRCMTLNIDNREYHTEDLFREYQNGVYSYEEYLERLRSSKAEAQINGR